MQYIRRRQRANLFAYPVTYFGIQLRRRLFAVIQRHVGVDGLAFDVMRNTDHRRFGDFRMRNQRGFNFRGAQTVAGDVQYVIDATGDPVVTIFVATGAVAAKVHIFKG